MTSSENLSSSRSSDVENTCVVCFKNADIYSIGLCDHPVCYECSTRMRVLCRQNECPICRQDIPEVIFTRDVKPSSILSKSFHSNFQDRKYGLKFFSPSIQRVYNQLLEHSCQLCSESEHRWRFRTFQQLKDHMRREHELFYCDLCVDNLKIFSFERKCYTRQELGQHRRKGDSDNTSHRGHPLCEFCDTRYMDSDELFRHLRRDHLYCHFCDADGKHQYYRTYDDLRNHFLEEHYLCEEGECKNEKFTSVFRTDIDYKAHIASVHSRHLSKAANRQARTLELEFTLAPRLRNDHNKGFRRRNNDCQEDEEGAVGYDNNFTDAGTFSSSKENSSPIKTNTNTLNSDDFPSLGNGNTTHLRPATSVTFMSKKGGDINPFSGEEFPVLGGTNLGSNKSAAVTISSKLNTDYAKAGGGNSAIRTPEVTITRTVRTSHQLNKNAQNFPALTHPTTAAGSSTSTLSFSVNSNSQDRSKAPNLSIHVNHKSNGAVRTMISTSSATSAKSYEVGQDSLNAFPALGSSASIPEPQWVSQKPKKNEQKISKVAAAPVLPPSSLTDFPVLSKNEKKAKKTSVTVPVANTWVNLNNFNNESKSEIKQKVKGTKVDKISNSKITEVNMENSVDANQNKSKLKKKKIKNEDKITSISKQTLFTNLDDSVESRAQIRLVKKRSELKINPLNVNVTELNNTDNFPVLGQNRPPPGFTVKPPPGFNNVNVTHNLANLQLASNITSSNDLTFTNSTGQSYSIRPVTKYCQPKNFSARNKHLIEKFMSILNENQIVQDFKSYSDFFRGGFMSADKYYEHCKMVLGEHFFEIFPEILVLLPDIEKQHELYNVYIVDGLKNDLIICENCKQIIMKNELKSHYSYHTLDNSFPLLNKTSDDQNAWKK